MKNQIIAIVLISLGASFSNSSYAQMSPDLISKIVEIDEDEGEGEVQSLKRCEDNAEAMSACRSFIKGFIQGALLTDAAIIKSIEDSEPSYAERAFKTRLGSRDNRSPTELAGFCLPEGRSILELAEETLDHVKDAERNSYELARKVYLSLKTDYKC